MQLSDLDRHGNRVRNESGSMPLYVDIDGTLIHSDLLIESALKFIKQSAFNIVRLLFWMLRGKASLKDSLALRIELDPLLLPYNEGVLSMVRSARAAGRSVVLATASHERYARAIAAHLPFFDDVLATGPRRNLSGGRKLAAIEAHAGGSFEYIGNARVDLPIWRKAAVAVVVSNSSALLAATRAANDHVTSLPVPRAGVIVWMKTIRLHQWAKNFLLFMPAMPVVAQTTPTEWWALCIAFVCFGLCASSVYILNDLFDLDADRVHHRKRFRPIPAGTVSLVAVCTAFVALLAAAGTLALLFSTWQFALVLGVYWVTTMAYSLYLKGLVVVDVLTLACLYTIRIIAGSAVLLLPPSFWILVFSMFVFLSLASAKRYVELSEMKKALKRKMPGRGYLVGDVPFILSLGVSSGLISVLIFALYVNDPTSHAHVHQPYALWLICPLLLFWVVRLWLKATRDELHDDPVVFAVTDRASQISALLALLLVLFGAYR